jgi:hypothetical protein
MSSQRLRVYISTLVLALTSVAGPAIAGTEFDGVWSVTIVTHSGACDASYRYGVQIADGMVINEGVGYSLHGQVTRSGAVRVVVESGGQRAHGSGRLTKNRGDGSWQGQGTSGTCGGSWMAERRR